MEVFACGPFDSIADEAAELAAKLAARYDVAGARVVRPVGPETTHPRGTRIQLKEPTADSCPTPVGPVCPVCPVTDWPTDVREAFAPFARGHGGRRPGLPPHADAGRPMRPGPYRRP